MQHKVSEHYPNHMQARPTKTFSVAEFRRAWLNPAMTRPEIGAAFGISDLQCWRRAKDLGLPPRKMGGRPKRTPDTFIRAAWRAGVSSREIAERAGISVDTLYNRLQVLGLALRGAGKKPTLTITEFDALQLRQALAARAREEQAALRNAEMWDAPRTGGCGRKAA